jgi:valyl-tRNA synthetase
MAQVVAEARKLNDDYQYGAAGQLIYDFIWSDVCDWYVELSKLALNARVLVTVLDTSLRLLHPFMPYVTEALWQKLKEVAGGALGGSSFDDAALMLAPYPIPMPAATAWERERAQMGAVQDVIRAIRNARSEYKVEPNKRIPALIQGGTLTDALTAMRPAIQALARVDESLVIAPSVTVPEQARTVALGEATVYLPMAGLVDLVAEKKRLADELVQLDSQIDKIDKLLASDFGQRAPAQVIDKERARLAEAQAKREQIRERLAAQ